ncbi:alpha/beta hydrolase [Sphingomonas sp. DBB INV C78]|uniref:esterase/lipase family protein n=1 Tax=Sphingomonas sp. DBB INV C78 TaxID=3349434 RepID=UPI0036D3323E
MIKPPSKLLTLAEPWRAGMEALGLLALAPLLALSPRGDGHVVLVLPGFATNDHATTLLRLFLAQQGYDARSWDLGWNLDHRTVGQEGELITARVEALRRESKRAVSLVGWSLGGVIAREAARRVPELVRTVVSLASPFSGDPSANAIRGLYEALSGNIIASPQTRARYANGGAALPVPSTAVFSQSDGIAAWRNCVGTEDAINENVEVHSSHFGMVVNPAVLHVIADRLAQPEGAWRRFTPPQAFGFLYPPAAALQPSP